MAIFNRLESLVFAAALCIGWVADYAVAQSPPELRSRSVVFNYPETDPYDPANRYGFNHAPSVTRLANGDLLCVWFSGPYEAAISQVILGSRSMDGGLTWGKAFVLNRTAHKSSFDPAFIADGTRTWLFFTVGRWNPYPYVNNKNKDAVGVGSYHTFACHSDDNGVNWSEAEQCPGTFFCRSNGVRLSSGELLLPVYTAKEGGVVVRPDGSKEKEVSTADQDQVYRSVDGGKTWSLGGGVSSPGGADEATIAEVSDGRVIMVLRTQDGQLWESYSSDNGATWSAPVKAGLPAADTSSNLFRLADGRIVLTHNPSSDPRKRTPLTIRISADDGKTWGEPLVVAIALPEPKSHEHQVTYPSVTQLPDSTLVVVWTEIVANDTQQYGDIWSARVRVDGK
jgi:predicted neuraminidase